MNIDVYCDEAHPDLFCSNKRSVKYMCIGSLWIPKERRQELKDRIHVLRNEHKVGGEFKWHKISPSKLDFYQAVIQLFFAFGTDLQFRCIIVEPEKVDINKFHEGDNELGFYKFYYHSLVYRLSAGNEYNIFCDYKSNRLPTRVPTLEKCLRSKTGLKIAVNTIRSEESVIIQMADVLTGACVARLNDTLKTESAKAKVVSAIEIGLGRAIAPTNAVEQKFNVFQIRL